MCTERPQIMQGMQSWHGVYHSKCLNSSFGAVTFMHVTKFKSVFQIRFLYISILAITVATGYPKYKNINGNLRFSCRRTALYPLSSWISTNVLKIPMILSWQMCCFGDQYVASCSLKKNSYNQYESYLSWKVDTNAN